MKKFLIGIIFIIPIVVVLALNATGAIISKTTPVNPTGVIVRNSNNVELKKGDVVKIDIDNFDEFIIVEVLPTITKNKDISYERDPDAGDGEVRLEKMGSSDRYNVIPLKVGPTKITIRAKANVNAYKEVAIHVTSNKLESISIFDASGEELGIIQDSSYEIYGVTRFYADIYPAEALFNDDVKWSSNNTSVAVVSDNGVVTPVSHGDARIKVQARDKDGNVISKHVDINTMKCVAKASTMYSSEAVDEQYVKENCALSPEETTVTALGNGKYELVYTNEEGEEYVSTITILSCEEGEFGFADDITCVYTRNGAYFVRIAYLDGGEVITDGVTYECDNPGVMRVASDGSLEPLNAGVATVRVTYNGVSIERTYTVRERPATFDLNLGSADAKLGIQLKRVWGFKWLQKTDSSYAVTDKYEFGVYGDSSSFDVRWSVSNDSYATITPKNDGTSNVYISFSDAAKGNKVTVTASLIVDGRTDKRVKRSFTFEMRNRIESVNVYDFEQVKYVNDNMKCNDFVLQNDIEADSTIDGITASVYGNGFKWDASKIESMNVAVGAINYNFWDSCSVFDEHEYWTSKGCSINFDDIVMFNAPTLEESVNRGSALHVRGIYHETRDATHGTQGIEGSPYGVYGRKDAPEDLPINIRFCQIYNTDRGIDINEIREALIEGCILGDNNNHSILSTYPTQKYRRFSDGYNLTLRNNVIKQSQGPAIMIMESVVNNDLEGDYAPNLKIEGCLDIYNWKEENDFIEAISNMVFQYVLGYVDGGEAIIGLVSGGVNKLLKEIIGAESESADQLYFGYAGKKYVSMGIFECGAMYEYSPKRRAISKEARLTEIELPFSDEDGNTLKGLVFIEDILKKYMKGAETIGNASYIICTDFMTEDPEIMPGDPVPNSIELYEKLRGEKK